MARAIKRAYHADNMWKMCFIGLMNQALIKEMRQTSSYCCFIQFLKIQNLRNTSLHELPAQVLHCCP